MAIDLQVCFPQEAVLLNQVRLIAMPVRSVDVLGSDFSSVDDVFINDIRSPDVVVLSRTRLLAQVPPSLGVSPILSVQVLSKRLTITPRSVLRFRISDRPGKISGLQRLVQLFLKVLLTTPGSDIFNKRLGAGALRNVGTTFGSDEGGDIVNDFIIAVGQAARQLVAIQSRNTSLPQSERLLRAKVVRAGFNADAGGLDVTVEILSQTGEFAQANVGI